MVTLLKHVSNDTNAADLYLSIEREDLRWAWATMMLKEAGFIEGVAIGK